MKLDLHGLPIHSAWSVFNSKIQDAYYEKLKYVVVVTGQEIKTTEGIINVTNQMNMNSGSPDGDMAAQGFFVHGMDDRNEFNG